MRKLFTTGCSVSTKNNCKTSYPEELAKLLNYELVDLSAGCGSNHRIWRLITKNIIEGNLTSNDILIIQYTEPYRREFWSRFKKSDKNSLDDDFDDGRIIRFKMEIYDSHKNIKQEKEFLKLYEENFLSEKFELEIFFSHNFNFQHMLEAKNIKAIFIKTNRMNKHLDWYIADSLKKYVFYDDTNNEIINNQTPEDSCHFSDIGHKLMAENLYNHIINLKLNEQ